MLNPWVQHSRKSRDSNIIFKNKNYTQIARLETNTYVHLNIGSGDLEATQKLYACTSKLELNMYRFEIYICT